MDGAATLGVALDAAQIARLDGYLDAMLDVNQHVNLTSIRDRGDAVVRHLLDSLSVVPAWHAVAGAAPPKRVLDLGTGGGFPGAVLAVAWPSSRVLMLDSTGKKVRAVTQCLKTAGVANAQALQVRGEQAPTLFRDMRGAYDLCIARAVGPAARLVRELSPLVARRGFVLLMKGPNTLPEEIAEGEREAERQGLMPLPTRTADVPGLERRLVLVYAKG